MHTLYHPSVSDGLESPHQRDENLQSSGQEHSHQLDPLLQGQLQLPQQRQRQTYRYQIGYRIQYGEEHNLHIELNALRVLYGHIPGGFNRRALEDGCDHDDPAVREDEASDYIEQDVELLRRKHSAIEQ